MKKKLFLSVLTSIFIVSCSNENDSIIDVIDYEVGRFDDKPFSWDVSSHEKGNENNLFIGETYLDIDTTNTRGTQDQVLIDATPRVYVGAVYGYKSVDNLSFSNEISEDRNPIDVIFDFYDPFIDQITAKTGSVGYKLALKRAIKSDEYLDHISSGFSNRTEYSITQFSSYMDIKKGFSNNASIGKVFSAKVQSNYQSTKIKSVGKLFARFENVNFTVYMDQPSSRKGFFLDPAKNEPLALSTTPVYISSISYGRMVYLAIESEYQYDKVKWAIETSAKANFGSISASIDKEITQIMNKSVLTAIIIGDESKSSYYIDGYENLKKAFNANVYNSKFYGLPVFIQARVLPSYEYFVPSETNYYN